MRSLIYALIVTILVVIISYFVITSQVNNERRLQRQSFQKGWSTGFMRAYNHMDSKAVEIDQFWRTDSIMFEDEIHKNK